MRVLVVQHEPECPPALVGAWLLQEGAALDVRCPYAGEALPRSLADHDGLVVLGGHMGANDDADFPWLTAVKGLVRDGIERNVPTLGICLGHQLMAVALGGTVQPNPLGRQVGLYDVGWVSAVESDPLLGGLGEVRGVQWNDDVVTRMPDDGVVLARAPRGEVQAARFGEVAWGLQLHPEADAGVVAGWAALDPGPHADRVLDDSRAAAEELAAAWRPLAKSFVALAAQ